jgi:hypothetical protein
LLYYYYHHRFEGKQEGRKNYKGSLLKKARTHIGLIIRLYEFKYMLLIAPYFINEAPPPPNQCCSELSRIIPKALSYRC